MSLSQRPQNTTDHGLSAPAPFDKALGTRKWCIIGLGFCYVLSITLICTGSAFWNLSGYDVYPIWYCYGLRPKIVYYGVSGLPKSSVEIWLLAFNLLVTLATECVGYIHTTSLRWALYHENRLRHNSNLRLFTSSKHSMPNRWYVNAFWLLLISVSYSCASQLVIFSSFTGGTYNVFVPYTGRVDSKDVVVSSLSLITLGCCLCLLSLLATWTLAPTYSSHIASWNSDPLNTALATQHARYQKTVASARANAKLHQSSMISNSSSIKYMLIFLWLLVPLVLVASIVTWNLTGRKDTSFIYNWFDLNPGPLEDHWPLFLIDTKENQCNRSQDPLKVVVNILFVAALQLLYTVALHVAEQFVNLHRDERAWRHASNLEPKTGGALVGRDAMKAAVTAWPTVLLFIMKPTFHWVFGLSFPVGIDQMILYHPLPMFTLTAMVTLLASFATYLALRHPKGPQPSAYGNIDQLLGMIDDWGKGAGVRIYWGDKSGQDGGTGLRRAGTSGDARDLTEVKVDGQPYTGIEMEEVTGHGMKRRIRWCF